ncbi:hypothetical protein Tco_1428481 [Tanacetum coccineum]
MSTSTHPIIILTDSNVEDAFPSTNALDYTSASLDYSPASPGNTSFDPLEDSSKDRSAYFNHSTFLPDPYMKCYHIATFDLGDLFIARGVCATSEKRPVSYPFLLYLILLPPPHVFEIERFSCDAFGSGHMRGTNRGLFESLCESLLKSLAHAEDKVVSGGNAHRGYPGHFFYFLATEPDDMKSLLDMIHELKNHKIYVYRGCIMDMINNQDIEHMIPPTPPRDTEPPVGSPIPLSPSSSVGSSSLVRSTTPPPDYPFDESIFAELDNSLWIIPRPQGSEPFPDEPNELDAC